MPITRAAATEAQHRVLERMPVVSELVERLRRDGFRFGPQVQLFGTQHLLAQSLGLCGALDALGLPYRRMALAGKAYSTNPDTFSALRALGVRLPRTRRYRLADSHASEQVRDLRSLAAGLIGRRKRGSTPLLLVIDDGGHALTHVRSWFSWPWRIAGVEQTASGFRQPGIGSIHFPTVDVAASAIKRRCESPIVIDAVLRRAGTILESWRGGPIGIVGLGHVGMALYRRLAAKGFCVHLFDERPDVYPERVSGQRLRSAWEILDKCALIFGCTGEDITRSFDADVRGHGLTPRRRCLVSLSSGDDEFFTLKRRLLRGRGSATYALDNIPDVAGSAWGSEFVILRNGFPINFDNGLESAPLEHIQGTIAALIAALCQASTMAGSAGLAGRTKLDSAFQAWLFDRWLPFLPARARSRERLHPALIDRLSEPRTGPVSLSCVSPFGSWTADRRPR